MLKDLLTNNNIKDELKFDWTVQEKTLYSHKSQYIKFDEKNYLPKLYNN